MPVQVYISQIEADALAAAEISGVQGTLFTYSPADTLSLIERVQEAGHEGADRVVTRLSTLLGKKFLGSFAAPAAEPIFSDPKGADEEAEPEIVEAPSPAPKRRRKNTVAPS